MNDLEIQLELIEEIQLDREKKLDIITRVTKLIADKKPEDEVFNLIYEDSQLIGYVEAYDIDKLEKLVYQFCQMIC